MSEEGLETLHFDLPPLRLKTTPTPVFPKPVTLGSVFGPLAQAHCLNVMLSPAIKAQPTMVYLGLILVRGPSTGKICKRWYSNLLSYKILNGCVTNKMV